MKKIKKSNLIIIIVLVVLIGLIGVFAILNQNNLPMPSKGKDLLIFSEDNTKVELTIDEIKKLPTIEFEKTISSSKEDDESGLFTGVPLEVLLDEVSPDWEESYTEFLFIGEDSFVSSVFASDVSVEENVILVYEKDGEPLLSRDEGGKGPLRIVVRDDPFGNRSTYLLKTIELK